MARRRTPAGPSASSARVGRARTREPITAEQIVNLAVLHNLAEIEVEQDGTRIRVVREHAPVGPSVTRVADLAAHAQAAVEPAAASNLVPIEAPMVGTFYRAPGPDATPFVSEGDVVKEGQVAWLANNGMR